MRTLENIISDSGKSQRLLLQEAFEAGRAAGREEAAIDLRAKIDGVLSISKPNTTGTFVALHSDNGKRAISGSVKPMIERMIADSAKTGLTADEIGKATNFKPNSIRGTLWTLSHNGFAVKRQGRWFPVRKDETEATRASASH